MDVKKRGFLFSKGIICVSLKDLVSKARKNKRSVKEHEITLKKHNIHQEFYWQLYHIWRVESMQLKNKSYV